MWYRIKGNTREWSCGDVAEQWVVLGRLKTLLQTYICHTCQPLLAEYVRRQPSIGRQYEEVGYEPPVP